jgi:hypothetical protein
VPCFSKLFCVVACLFSAASEAERIPYYNCFDIASRRHGVDLVLLASVAQVESNWNADARSPANAHGIMQIRWPLTARHLGAKRVAELYNPCLNIDIGAAYLAELAHRYDGDHQLMLAAYNYGPTRIRGAADIPPGVLKYVQRVQKKQASLVIGNAGINIASVENGMAFLSRHQATNYTRALQRQIPSATLATHQLGNLWQVVVDDKGLTHADRHKLRLLFGTE